MSQQARGGFRPPKHETMIWKCEKCETFNSVKDAKCKKCGEEKPEKK